MVPAPSDATATMPLSQDEQNSSIIQQGVKPKELHSGNVVLLDGRKLDFQVSKNAEGEILFNLVTDAIGLIEKDYFSLAFYENGSVRKWLYKNKKIQKQVKDLPWDFSLEVKFYTPDPSQLADDFTRHLLTLQLRTDIYNGKLPASLVNQAHLGSLIAQAELGDYSPEKTYGQSLRALNIVPNMSDELESKIIQLYKDQKGKTPPEAELSFLMACRELTLYGMVMFSAKHNGKPVRVGINSAGISVFQEHLRQNYVVWQGMHQLEYQRKSFTIKLKHGEKEGKSSLTFKLDTEPLAKLCWRTAVEHHTFFRLMQPEDKTNKGGFFQLGSGRFRPEGRTHFQTKMASQMFDGTPTAGPQISSAQIVSRSSENLPAANQGSSPVHYADDKSMEGSSPQKRYTITSHMETNSPRTSTLDRSLEFSSKDKKSNKSSKQVSASSSSSDSEVEVEERHAVQNEKKNEELPRVRLIARKLEIEQQESGPMYQKASPAKSFAWPNVRELRRYFSHMKVIDGASSLSRRLRRSHRSVYKCESETAPPHTTLQSWHETETSPEQIVTEIDEHGNVIKKTIKTSHETHTIQKQTYQTFSVGNDANEPNGTSNSIENALETIQSINSSIPTAASHAQTRVLVYGKDGEQLETSDVQYDENQVVSSKVVTTGNRTIETITYKTVKDGVVSTNVEHRVTIQGPEVDHEAELRKAIIEATGLNPRYEVQRVEVKQERLA